VVVVAWLALVEDFSGGTPGPASPPALVAAPGRSARAAVCCSAGGEGCCALLGGGAGGLRRARLLLSLLGLVYLVTASAALVLESSVHGGFVWSDVSTACSGVVLIVTSLVALVVGTRMRARLRFAAKSLAGEEAAAIAAAATHMDRCVRAGVGVALLLTVLIAAYVASDSDSEPVAWLAFTTSHRVLEVGLLLILLVLWGASPAPPGGGAAAGGGPQASAAWAGYGAGASASSAAARGAADDGAGAPAGMRSPPPLHPDAWRDDDASDADGAAGAALADERGDASWARPLLADAGRPSV
jgi:hypothetical protein